MDPSPPRISTRLRIGLAAYGLLLLLSQVWIATRPQPAPSTPPGSSRVALSAPPLELSALHWPATDALADGLPVLLLHGSPGMASDMTDLAARLSADGREVLSLDLPGFGASATAPGGRSILAHAQSALACVPWPQFHVAAWSMGGGVALHMAEFAPERVRSVALIASIGVQEAEGSGNFYFEHLKYALTWALLVPGAELIPHFGLLGERASRRAFCLNFWESDQRPLRAILAGLKQPLFIAHGRRDFLVPLWCAEQSHQLVEHSRLLVFDASHFLLFNPPFGQLDVLAPDLEAFFARHDVAGVPEARSRLDLSVERPSPLPEPYRLPRQIPWWLAFAALFALAARRPWWCGMAVGALGALLQLDLGLGLCAALLGAGWHAWRTPRPRWKTWLIDLARILGACPAAAILAVWLGPRLCALVGAWVGLILLVLLPILASEAGARVVGRRRRTRAAAAAASEVREREHEQEN